ncbi:hypothetical protein ACOMHN_021759 [Nucella lapillus]
MSDGSSSDHFSSNRVFLSVCPDPVQTDGGRCLIRCGPIHPPMITPIPRNTSRYIRGTHLDCSDEGREVRQISSAPTVLSFCVP